MSIATPSRRAAPNPAATLIKLVTFAIGPLNLALPITAVHKVVNLTSIYGSGIYPVGVAAIGDRNYTIIDLHQHLFQSSPSRENPQAGYLLLVQLNSEELIGIPVIEAPSLVEVPTSLVRVLPESYRRADTLAIASHIAIVPEAEGSRTLFLLDVNALVDLVSYGSPTALVSDLF